MRRNIFSTIWRSLRRNFYRDFYPKYIENSLKLRKGSCRGCGCCKLAYIPCPHFDKNTDMCMVWDDLSETCKEYPFDEKDKHPLTREQCGFYWEQENQKILRSANPKDLHEEEQ